MSRRVASSPATVALQVLRALETASETSEGRPGFVFKHGDWSIGERLNSLPPLAEVAADTISGLAGDQHRLEYIIQLSKALTASASELLKIYERHLQPLVSKLSKGLASLPDDILKLIFKFSTLHEEEGTRHAFWLSHVSHKFRRVVLGDRSLWSTQFLGYDSTEENVRRCISRSGKDADLSIVINIDLMVAGSSPLNAFMSECLPAASRWRTLTYIGDGSSTYGSRILRLFLSNRLVLPRLFELRMHASQEHYHSCSNTDFEYGTGWVAPNLRVVRCTQHIPSPSFPFTSITIFSLSSKLLQRSVDCQVTDLLKFLSSMPNLSDVDLELKIPDDLDASCSIEDEPKLQIATTFVCPAVTSFRLHILDSSSSHAANGISEPIIKALRMPKLERFTLSFEFRGSGTKFHMEVFEPIYASIPDPATHPLLISLAVKVSLPESQREGATSSRSLIVFPLDKVVHIPSLTLTTFGQVYFCRKLSLGQGAPSSLRELQLRSCKNMDVGDLWGAIQSLKDVRVWNMLDRVVIQGCDLLGYESAARVVGKERLRFLK